jgi:heme-degrading monooxygenase HmoA
MSAAGLAGGREDTMLDVPAGTVMRSWTGWIRPESRAAYAAYLERTGLADYRSTPGNLGAVTVFRDLPDGRCEVRTVSFWRSYAHITAFAGEDIEMAVFYPQDDTFLIDREFTVAHFEVA